MTADPTPPTASPAGLFVHGKLSFFQIPSSKPHRSAVFYAEVFGWRAELRDGGEARFVAPGEVIGHFVRDLEPAGAAGVVPYVYVDDVDAVIERARAHGGDLVQAPYPEGDLTVARVSDPDGNVIGVWRAPGG
jgi:uncharacterized protein